MARQIKLPRRFRFERELAHAGVSPIAGVDEAGRGPLAGPVVAAAVVLPEDWYVAGVPRPFRKVNDSKQLTPLEREALFSLLTECPGVSYGVAEVNVAMIDQINILQATHRAMNDALGRLSPPPAHALVDGLPVKTLHFPHTAVVDGDCLSYSIAAASIIAKVTRDRLMVQWHAEFPAYGFAEHKGYGTPEHLAAIQTHGPCPIHRQTFSPFRPVQNQLFQDESVGPDQVMA